MVDVHEQRHIIKTLTSELPWQELHFSLYSHVTDLHDWVERRFRDIEVGHG